MSDMSIVFTKNAPARMSSHLYYSSSSKPLLTNLAPFSPNSRRALCKNSAHRYLKRPQLTYVGLSQSQAIKTPTAIYCSGQIPLNASGTLVEGTIGTKTEQCIQNLKAVLAEAGSSIEKVVKVVIFLADMGDFAVRDLLRE
jgi:enamine deaminase RidA (YjgF/YER057c/UK114 family)